MRIAVCLLGCFLLLQNSIANAGDPVKGDASYMTSHFTDENGLPQNSVKSIAPDRDGFLWLLTEDGLTRFDGRQFLNFDSRELAIPGKLVHFFYPDATGSHLLALAEDNRLLMVDRGRAGPAKNYATDYRYLQRKEGPDTFYLKRLPDNNLSFQKDWHLIFPVETDAWFQVHRDTIYFRKNDREQYRFTFHGLNHQRLFLSGGRLCYLQADGQLTWFERGKTGTARLKGDLEDRQFSADQWKHMMFYWSMVTRQFFIYLEGNCYWLQHMPDGSLNAKRVLENFDFAGKSVVSLYYDDIHQRLFIGSSTQGLYVCTRKQFSTLNAEKGTANNVYYAQAPYGNNSILAASGILLDSAGGHRVPLIKTIRKAWDSYSILRGPHNDYWYKNDSYLYHLNDQLTKVLWQTEMPESITQLFLSKNGRLWIGGMENGLYMLDTNIPEHTPQLYAPLLKNASYIAEETSELLWIGTAKGLYRMHIPSRRIDTIPALSGKYVRSIYVPAKGEVWITTSMDGIFLFKNDGITPLPLDRRKYIASAHCIVKDKAGYLWVTTNKGLFQFSRKDALAYAANTQSELFYMYYGKEQGFNTNEFNGGCEPCALGLADGNVSLPSLDGLVLLKPDSIRLELPGKEIFINQMELNTKRVAVTEDINLKHNFQQLKFYLSSPYFGDPANLQLYYCLINTGRTEAPLWLPVNTEQTIEFSSLSSGEYELHIRKVNGFGHDNAVEKFFMIRVLPAWYEAIWIRLLAVVLSLLVMIVFFRYRIRSVQRKNRDLEVHVSARTKELKAALTHLQLSEEQLRKQTFMHQRLLASVSHDIRTPLEFLIAVIGEGYKQGVAINGDERDAAYESLQQMLHFVENMIRYMKSQWLAENTVMETVTLYPLLEEKMAIFRPLAQAKGIQLINGAPQQVSLFINRQILTVVLRNLLDNAVKYTKSGAVHIEAFTAEQALCIQIADTGGGMLPELMDWINQFSRNGYDLSGLPFTHTGLGLLIVLELLQLIDGSLEVSRNPMNGTTLVITLPLVGIENHSALLSRSAQ